jgi:CheY-like chemotaxis protein
VYVWASTTMRTRPSVRFFTCSAKYAASGSSPSGACIVSVSERDLPTFAFVFPEPPKQPLARSATVVANSAAIQLLCRMQRGYDANLPGSTGLALDLQAQGIGVNPQDPCAKLWPMVRSVLIVDDHSAFRAFARAVLQAEGFDVVGEAEDGASALEAVARLRPAVVLLDVQLPDLDGFEIAERLADRPNAPQVVLVSSRSASSYRRRLADTRARGFIPKAELSGAALSALVLKR